jgi:hypothetical protein
LSTSSSHAFQCPFLDSLSHTMSDQPKYHQPNLFVWSKFSSFSLLKTKGHERCLVQVIVHYLKTKGHEEYLFQVIVFGNQGCENYLVKSVKQWEECMVVWSFLFSGSQVSTRKGKLLENFKNK